MILRHGDNENYCMDVIEKDDVILTMSYVECQYVWSKPNGQGNTACGDRYLNKYQNQTGGTNLNIDNQPQSQSAASML